MNTQEHDGCVCAARHCLPVCCWAVRCWRDGARAERVKDIASVGGRAHQPAGRLRPGGGPERHRRPDHAGAIHGTEHREHAGEVRRDDPRQLASQMQLKNVAAVSVTADLPPFAKSGQTIDVTVASIGNAISLRGGALLMTPLRGADGEVYAMAQGSVLVSGFGVQGKDGSRVSVNVPSAGRIPNGAHRRARGAEQLRQPAVRDAESEHPGFHHRRAADRRASTSCSARAVRRRSTRSRSRCRRRPIRLTGWRSSVRCRRCEVEPDEAPARVIINSRTGTIVISSQVQVMAAAVAHGSLSVTITERQDVSQPNARSQGTTAGDTALGDPGQPADGCAHVHLPGRRQSGGDRARGE